jgi:glutaredoxin 3
MMKSVLVFTIEPCPYCRMVKSLLAKRGITFEEIDLSDDPGARYELVEQTGLMTFPQVIIDEQLLGGYDEVRAADQSGRLLELLAA